MEKTETQVAQKMCEIHRAENGKIIVNLDATKWRTKEEMISLLERVIKEVTKLP